MQNIFKNKWFILITISLVGFLLDLISKQLIHRNLNLFESVSLWGDVLQFQYIRNEAMIFGLNPKTIFPHFPLRIFQIGMSVIGFFVLIYIYMNVEKYLNSHTLFEYFALSLIMPGLLGNLADRFIYKNGGVVDFIRIDLGFPPFDPWPLFNAADIFLTISIVLILISSFLSSQKINPEKA